MTVMKSHRPLHLLSAALLLAATAACSGPSALLVQGQYTLSVPVTGAKKTAVHEGGLEVGALGTGTGTQFGGSIGARVRPFSQDAGGGSLNINFLTAVVPEAEGSPFFLTKVGLGLLGSTILTNEARTDDPVGNTFDFMTPTAEASIGYGLGGGMAVSAGVSVQYLWHVWNDHKPGANQLLVGFTVGIGAFDPGPQP